MSLTNAVAILLITITLLSFSSGDELQDICARTKSPDKCSQIVNNGAPDLNTMARSIILYASHYASAIGYEQAIIVTMMSGLKYGVCATAFYNVSGDLEILEGKPVSEFAKMVDGKALSDMKDCLKVAGDSDILTENVNQILAYLDVIGRLGDHLTGKDKKGHKNDTASSPMSPNQF